MARKSAPALMDKLAEEARRGRISRRDFMHYATAAGVTTATATGLWTTSAMAQPQSGGVFRIGVHDGNTNDSHDPGTYLSRQMIYLVHQYRSFLTQIESDGSLGGDLATEWSSNDTATEWTFRIVENATFHSGGNVTADDLIASMNHHRGETTSAAKALLETVVDIEKVDDYAIKFVLSSGNADLPWLMTDYHLCICPANPDGSMNWESADGSGPYRVVDGQMGVGFYLERHDGWHQEGAYFDALELIVINDNATRQTAILTDAVDAVSLVDIAAMSEIESNADTILENVPSAAAITMPMHTNTAPFDDVRVRQAVKHSIDRNDLIAKVAGGAATIGNDFHVSPAMPYWPDDIPQTEYDPDRAKALLAEAGHGGGLDITLSTAESVFSGAIDLAVLCAEHARPAGINIEVDQVPSDGYYTDTWLVKPWCVVSWGARPTPDVMFTLAYKDDAAWNEAFWQNERFNELLLLAKAELDDTVRAEMYREMCLIANQDGGTVIPFFNNFVFARRANIARPEQQAASWELDGARGPSRWWFSA